MANANSWAILPAANGLFGKNKVTLNEVATQRRSGTVVICRKPNNQIHFIAGAAGSYAELNTKHAVHHHQNPKMTFGGEFEVINEVTYETKEDGQVVFTWKDATMELGKGANEEFKACLAVFK